MATSGSVSTNVADGGTYFWVKWSIAENGQSIAENKTTINWSCGVYCRYNYYTNAVTMSAVTINGTQVYDGGTYSNLSHYTNYTLGSGTLDITHASDGTKTFTINKFTGWTYASNNYSAEATNHTLNTIPRIATVSAGTDFTDEGNPTITFSNPAGFRVSPYLNVYDNSNNLVFSTNRTLGSYSSPYTFTLTSAERTRLKNATTSQTSYKVNEGVDTYNGSTYLGYSSIEKRLSIVNANPTFTANQVTVVDTNSSVVAVTGSNSALVLTLSTPQASWTVATPKKGATISKYRFEWQGQTVEKANNSSPISFNLTTSGSTTMKITAIDSRGFETQVTKTINVINYANPNGIVTYGRVNNYEDDTKLKIDGSFSSVQVGGTEKNSQTIQWRSKQNVEGASWSSWTTVQDNVENTYSLDKNNEYIIECKVTDAFGNYWSNLYILLKGKFPLFIDTGLNAVGINDFPKTGEAFRVQGGTSRFEDEIYVTGYTVGRLCIPPSVPSDASDYFRCQCFGNPDDSGDKYYILLDSDNTFYFGTQLNGASEVTWSGIIDYVVARGQADISGITWYYEKWNSGKSECWASVIQSNVSIVNAWGSVYESGEYGAYHYPPSLFNSAPSFYAQFVGTNDATLSTETLSGNSSTQTPIMYATRPTARTITAILNMHAIGRWK